MRREKADKLKQALELKKVARLIDAELASAVGAITICVERKEWWPVMKLSTEAWHKYIDRIVPELSNEAWD